MASTKLKRAFFSECWGVAMKAGELKYTLLLTGGGRPVYVSNGSHILKYSKDDARVDVVYGKSGFRILGLAVDFGSQSLFWSDTSPEFKGIHRGNLDGKNVTTIVKDVKEPSDIAVDWVSNHIYWVDTKAKTIEVADYDGLSRKILVSTNLREPRNIAADPISGYIFWVDQRAKRIERSWLDGSHRRVIIKSKNYWPNQLSVSYKDRKLYWADARNHAIFSSSLKGANTKKERGIKSITQGAPPYGLVVYGNTAVVSTWFSTALYLVLIGTDSTVWQLGARDLGTRELYSLVSLNPITQPKRQHPCGYSENGGCSHLCLPGKGHEYKCACPTYGGLALTADGKTCQVPSQLLFVTLQQYGEVGFISLDKAADADFSLVGKSTKPAAVTYDPVDQVVYWSDSTEKRIYSIYLDGTDQAVLLNSSDGVGAVQGMAFDWKSGRLYFTNVGHSGPNLDGTVYSWHTVVFVEVNTKKRKTILYEVENPLALALDLNQRHLYISESGKDPKILRADLDGQNLAVIKKTGSPSGLSIFEDTVYFFDSYHGYNSSGGDIAIETYNTVDGSFENIGAENVVPQVIAATEEMVYMVDPVSHTLATTNGSYVQLIMKEGGVSGLAYSQSSAAIENDTDSCSESGCSEGCVELPWNQMSIYRCICYDGAAKVLQEDEKMCARPRNFLLYADMTTINMLSLDPGADERPTVLHHGDTGSNYVALTFDWVKDRIYWSDHTSQAIYLSNLSKISPVMLYKETGFIEGLVIDPVKQRLYWTVVTSQTGAGYIARLNIERGLGSYKKLQASRNNPRAITLHPTGKWLYWTEHKAGANGVEVYTCKTNGQRYRKLMSVDLHWPNSLVVYDDKLYIGDGRGKIIVSNIEGWNLEVLADSSSTFSHVFGLAVFGDFLLYSDWDTNSINMIDMDTDFRTSLVSNLTRPTAIALYHPDDLSDHVCYKDNENPCSDICRPLLRGLHQCLCQGDQYLADDEATCIEDLPTTTEILVPITRPAKVNVSLQETPDTNNTGIVTEIEDNENQPMDEVQDTAIIDDKAEDTYEKLGEETYEKQEDAYERQEETYEKPDEETYEKQEGAYISYEKQEEDAYEKPEETYEKPEDAYEKEGDTFKEPALKEFQDITTESNVNQATTAVKPLIHFSILEPMVVESTTLHKDSDDTTLRKDSNDIKKEEIEAGEETLTDDDDKLRPTTGELTENLVEDGRVQLQPIGPPVFESCPSKETVLLSVPESGDHVIYPIIPRAFDSIGAQLTVSSSYKIDEEGIHLHWEGDEMESHHTVVLWAIDSHNQEVVCEINVTLQDVDPPIFTFCPKSIKVNTVREAEIVHWSKPEVRDNIGVAYVNGSHTPGSLFPPGKHVVNYTATDRAWNKAYCSFTVIVSEDKVCELPEIQHGGIVCSNDEENEGECSVVCEVGYIVNPIRIFRRAFNCRHPDEIESMTKAMVTQSPCLLRRYPSIIHKEFHLLFRGPVHKHKPEVLSYISTTVSDHLSEEKLCERKYCRVGNVSAYCGFRDRLCIQDEEEGQKQNFFAMFNITVTNSTGSRDVDMLTLLEKIHQELMYFASALSVQIDEHHYEAVADAVTARQHTWSCSQGQIFEKTSCIACPVGTYHNASLDVCQYCSRGSYQDLEGQRYCFMCRPGQTSPDGATHKTQCNAIPSMDEMTLFIIVTACSFGVVFLCMAITLYLQFKRQQKRNEKVANQKKTRYNMTPNIYVAPPPILKSKLLDENASLPPRTYSIDKKHPFNIYANHDYEDVDKHMSNYPSPLYQNDTFKSSAANSLNFPSAESPSTDHDDLSMGTLSRENTFRNSSLQFGVKRSTKGANTPSPGPQRKMSRESTFSTNSPQMMRMQRTPSSDGPGITQSPLLRLKLAAYNFNHDD